MVPNYIFLRPLVAFPSLTHLDPGTRLCMNLEEVFSLRYEPATSHSWEIEQLFKPFRSNQLSYHERIRLPFFWLLNNISRQLIFVILLSNFCQIKNQCIFQTINIWRCSRQSLKTDFVYNNFHPPSLEIVLV